MAPSLIVTKYSPPRGGLRITGLSLAEYFLFTSRPQLRPRGEWARRWAEVLSQLHGLEVCPKGKGPERQELTPLALRAPFIRDRVSTVTILLFQSWLPSTDLFVFPLIIMLLMRLYFFAQYPIQVWTSISVYYGH